MKIELDAVVPFLKARAKASVPIDFVKDKHLFAQFWYEYVLFVSSKIEEYNPSIAEMHSALIYHIPTVALIPGRYTFLVFVKNSDFEDVYLAYNSAYVSASRERHLYIVPFIDYDAMDALVEIGMNPAVLFETIYILPILVSIPCTRLLDAVPIVKDFLTVRMQSYLSSRDLAQALLGFLMLRLLSVYREGPLQYESAFERVKGIVHRTLTDNGLHVIEHVISTSFADFPVDILVMTVTR